MATKIVGVQFKRLTETTRGRSFQSKMLLGVSIHFGFWATDLEQEIIHPTLAAGTCSPTL